MTKAFSTSSQIGNVVGMAVMPTERRLAGQRRAVKLDPKRRFGPRIVGPALPHLDFWDGPLVGTEPMAIFGRGCVNVWPAPSARVLVSSVDQSTPTYPVSGRTLAKMEIRTSWSS